MIGVKMKFLIEKPVALLAGLLATVAVGSLPAQAADVAAPIDLWSGFYLGAQAGYLQGTGSDRDYCFKSQGGEERCFSDDPDDGFDVGDSTADGVTVGGYGGFNYRMDSFLLGVEGDFNWDNAQGSDSLIMLDIFGSTDMSLKWDASIRARLGMIVDERALLYVTGGPSWINVDLDFPACDSIARGANPNCGDSNTEFGWQLGAGVEYFVTDSLSIKAEYLHGWYGDADLNIISEEEVGALSVKQDLQTDVVRAGVAFHFGGL
jgi:outer membrane immunogenic protein